MTCLPMLDHNFKLGASLYVYNSLFVYFLFLYCRVLINNVSITIPLFERLSSVSLFRKYFGENLN